MRRILILLATLAIALGLAAPVALAAEPVQNTAQVLVAINRSVTIAEGDHLDTLIVIGGDARISGEVGTVVVAVAPPRWPAPRPRPSWSSTAAQPSRPARP